MSLVPYSDSDDEKDENDKKNCSHIISKSPIFSSLPKPKKSILKRKKKSKNRNKKSNNKNAINNDKIINKKIRKNNISKKPKKEYEKTKNGVLTNNRRNKPVNKRELMASFNLSDKESDEEENSDKEEHFGDSDKIGNQNYDGGLKELLSANKDFIDFIPPDKNVAAELNQNPKIITLNQNLIKADFDKNNTTKIDAIFRSAIDGSRIDPGSVSSTQRRKHQINSLAFDAQRQNIELQQARVRKIMSKRETKAKYGW